MPKRSLLLLALFLTANLPALAAPHAAFKPNAVDRNVPTYKQKGVVGPVYFFTQELTPEQKRGPLPGFALNKLSFKQGNPPAVLWDRGYYPCTMGEAMAQVPKDQAPKNWAHAVLVWLDGNALLKGWGDPLQESWKNLNGLGMEYNTVAQVYDALTGLPAGPHKLTIWHQINYKAWILGSDGYHFWDDRYIALAKSTIDVEVSP